MRNFKLDRGVAKQVLQEEGRIFGATYVKKNGEITKINGRFGVRKFLRGGKASSPNVWTCGITIEKDTPH